MEANKREQAVAAFNSFCKALDAREWSYEKDEKELSIGVNVNGDDLPMEFIIHVEEDAYVVSVLSVIPTSFPEDKCMDGAIATTVINQKFYSGCFDYDLGKGRVVFRLTQNYKDSLIGESVYDDMIGLSCAMVDEYNDKLFALAKGLITMEEFLDKIA